MQEGTGELEARALEIRARAGDVDVDVEEIALVVALEVGQELREPLEGFLLAREPHEVQAP